MSYDHLAKMVFTTARDIILIHSFSRNGQPGPFLLVNEMACKCLEYSEDELCQLTPLDIVDSKCLEEIPEEVKKLDELNELYFEKILVTKSGRRIHVEINTRLFIEDQQKIAVSIARDTSWRLEFEKQLTCNKEFYEEILDNVQDGIWVTDDQDVIFYTNRGMENIAGIPKDQIIGSRLPTDFDSVTISEFNKFYVKARKTLNTLWYEVPVTTPAGRKTWQNGWLIPRVKNGHFTGMICTIRDITKRIQFEQAMLHEKEKALQFFNVAGVMLLELNTEQIVTRINPKGCEILGYSEAEIVGQNWFERFVQVEDLDEVRSVYNQIINGILDPVEYFENPIIRKDGELRLIAWHNSIIYDRNHEIIGLFSSGEDITERSKFEDREREVLQRLQLAMESAQEGIWEWDFSCDKVTFDEISLRMLGYDQRSEQKQSDWWLKQIHPEDIDFVQEQFSSFLEGKNDYSTEFRLRRKDGAYVWVSSIARIIRRDDNGQPLLVVGIHRDITQRKKAELDLIESKNRFDLAMKATNDGLYDWNLITNEIYFSPGWKRMVGYQDHEIENKFSNWEKLTDPEGVKAALQHLQDHVDGKVDRFEIEFRMQHKDGHWIDVLSRATAFVDDETGKPYRVVGTHQDVTQRNKLQLQLRTINLALENSLNGFDIIDEDHQFIYVNKAYVSMWGYEHASEIIGCSAREHCEDSAVFDKIIGVVERDGNCVIETRAKRKDGSLFDVLMYVRKDHDYTGKVIYPTTSIDISHRKQAEREKQLLEEQLRHSQKMEAIATLAGGIAHDFNNMLAVIVGNTSEALNELHHNPDLRENFRDVLKAADQAKNLTQQLLTFARGGDPVKTSKDINEVLKESISLVTRGTKTGCNLTLAPNLRAAEIDSGQFHQVISNIVINASQAMAEGGNIYVNTESIELGDNVISGLKAGHYIKITIRDEGVGIPSEHLSQVFDPFFTTKQKGSGLGLATTYSIVKKHHGHIDVKSHVGKGTRFVIYLPASDKVNPVEPGNAINTHQGTGRVLILDDDRAVLRMLSRMLNRLGYDAVSTLEGTETVAEYKRAFEDGKPFDVVILDLTIPGGMGGAKVMPELQKINPRVKAIVSSGYSNDPIMANYHDYGFCGVAPKPYTRSQLVEILACIQDNPTCR